MISSNTKRESPLACDMSAIEPALREQHINRAKELFRVMTDIRELPDGYAFCFPDEEHVLVMLAEFISLEKLCCPFLGFVIEVEPEGGPLCLRLMGREGVKAFIREEVSGLLGGSLNWTV